MVLRKKQLIMMVSIAVVSFLIGTTFNSMTMASDGGNPWDRVWEVIYELEAQVDELKIPQVITATGHAEWTQLDIDVWIDLLSISEVAISEGANVLAIASGSFYCSEVTQSSLRLRHRANENHGERIFQGFTGKREMNWIYGAARETIEIHHIWTNLRAGTYTFGIQYYVCVSREVHVINSRLTLIIF